MEEISIHAPRAGSDRQRPPVPRDHPDFNPRSPCGERPPGPETGPGCCRISIHAPRAGSDYVCPNCKQTTNQFQSTLPVRGATHSMGRDHTMGKISIHAPRAGSDVYLISDDIAILISIHAPRAGSDKQNGNLTAGHMLFQSTLPVRGATNSIKNIIGVLTFQSTLPVRGATLMG